MEVVVRRHRPTDAPATARVFAAAVRVTAARYYTAEQVDAWCPGVVDERRWAAARARAWTVVAELDGEVVGFSDLTGDGELDMLFVAPWAGGRGVARTLVEAVVDQARSRGLRRVTTRASRAALPVFQRLGFVVDRANEDNLIRGVAVPNFSLHLDL